MSSRFTIPKQRRRALLGMLLLMSVSGTAWAQRPVKGLVKSNQQNLQGATIRNITTGKTISSDAAGTFLLDVNVGDTIRILALGYAPQEIVVDNAFNLTFNLVQEDRAVEEVVVTALGIKKEKKALGYAVQEVKGADLVKAREPNGINSLTGKVAGLTITPSSNLFGDPGIYLRGRSGVLIVVDGVPISSDSWNLSPDDIESYSVLKGANAAALYGQRGINGAIVVTTKKGTKTKGFAVDFNSSSQLQTGFNAIPKAQTEYGAGDNFKYAFKDGLGGGTNDSDYNVWGPRFEGQPITQYNSPTDPATGNLVPIPWLARGKNNLTDYLRNGFLSTNNVAIAASNEVGDVRMSISQMFQRGQVPNTKLGSTNFNLSGGINAGKKVRFEANINYNRQYTPNYPNLGYGPMNIIYLMQVWGGADYDVKDLKNYWQPGKEGIQQYNREYTIYNNPWFVAYENLRSYYKDDVYGYLQMRYKIDDHFTFNARTNVSSWNRTRTIKYPMSGDFYEPFRKVGGYQETYDNFWENNTEASLNYENKFGDLGFKGSVFGNLRTVSVNYLHGSTRGGLIVPGVYDLSNSVEQYLPTNDKAMRQVGSVYGFTEFDYKNFLFLNLTGRFDKSSTMPKHNNTYFYPSASFSALFSEMFALPKAISLLKLRGSYANIASDLVSETDQYGIYKLYPEYSAYSTRWDNEVGVGYSGTLYNNEILPSRNKTFEVGLEARFLKNRVGLDVAYFQNIEGPGIVNVSVSQSSGVSSIQKNAYTYVRKGLEITVDAVPVKTTDFTWNVIANWSTNQRWLDKIDGVLQRNGMTKVGDRADGYFITDFQRDENGNMIVGRNGLPAYNPYQTRIGYSNNNFVLSLNNSFKYKDFGLSFQFDGRFGGLIYNYVDNYQWNSGTAPESASAYRLLDWENRDNASWKGTVMTDGLKIASGQLNTDQDGNVISDTRVFAPNDVPVLWQTWSRNYYRSGDMLARSRTFVKLREVVLSYSFPQALLQHGKVFKSASVSLVGRNLLYFTGKGTKNMDLDQFLGDASFQTPSVKSFGLNLNASF